MRVQTLAVAAAICLQISSIASAQISLSSVSLIEDVLREGDPAELVVSWRSATGGVTGTITFESSDPTLFPAPEPVEVSGGPVGTVRRTIEPARLTGLIGASVTLTARTDAPAPGDVRSASLVVRPVHDDCGGFGGAWQIFTGETLEGSLAQATPDGTAGCLVGTDPPDVWHRFIAPGNGTLTLSACGTHTAPASIRGWMLSSRMASVRTWSGAWTMRPARETPG